MRLRDHSLDAKVASEVVSGHYCEADANRRTGSASSTRAKADIGPPGVNATITNEAISMSAPHRNAGSTGTLFTTTLAPGA